MERDHNEMIDDDVITMEEAIEKGYKFFIEKDSGILRAFSSVDASSRHLYCDTFYAAFSDGTFAYVNDGKGTKIEVIF